MGRSWLCRVSTVVGLVALTAFVARAWVSDDVSTVAAVGASAVLGATFLLVGWWVSDDWLLRREERAERPPISHPPSDHRPIEVGRLVLTRGRGARSGLAATLLMLAHERAIDVDGLDSVRYVVRIPPEARGRIAGEDEMLAELRQGSPDGAEVELRGPPLPPMEWGRRDQRIIADVHRRLVDDGVLHGRWWGLAAVSPLVIVPLTLSGSGGWLVLGIVAGVAVSVVMLMAAAGYAHTFTQRGRELRRGWLAYARWLRSNSELEHVGAPGVAIWGEHLAYATVLGSAPVAARAFSSA